MAPLNPSGPMSAQVWLVAAAVARRDSVVACDGQLLDTGRHEAKIGQESTDYSRSDGGLVTSSSGPIACPSFGTLKNLSSSRMLWVASRGGKCRAPQT